VQYNRLSYGAAYVFVRSKCWTAKLAQELSLVTYILEISGLNLGRTLNIQTEKSDIRYKELGFVIWLSLPISEGVETYP
jgi:hypothetical protein